MRFSIWPPGLQRSKEAMKNKSVQISNPTPFFIKITAIIHKNLILMFVRFTVFEVKISPLRRFDVNQPFWYVVCEHLHNLEDGAPCLNVFCFRVGLSLTLYIIRKISFCTYIFLFFFSNNRSKKMHKSLTSISSILLITKVCKY